MVEQEAMSECLGVHVLRDGLFRCREEFWELEERTGLSVADRDGSAASWRISMEMPVTRERQAAYTPRTKSEVGLRLALG